MAQRLDERPLVVYALVEAAFGQPRGTGDGVRPEAFDRVPHRAVVAGRPYRPQLYAFGVAPVELALDKGRDVDVIDEEVADESGHADVDEPRVGDLNLAQVTVSELFACEVRAREAGTVERAGAVVVSGHRAIVANSVGGRQP